VQNLNEKEWTKEKKHIFAHTKNEHEQYKTNEKEKGKKIKHE